jgi:hypothetical protein
VKSWSADEEIGVRRVAKSQLARKNLLPKARLLVVYALLRDLLQIFVRDLGSARLIITQGPDTKPYSKP